MRMLNRRTMRNGSSRLYLGAALAAAATIFAVSTGFTKASEAAPRSLSGRGASSEVSLTPLALVDGDNFKVEGSASCAGDECTASIRLEAKGDYHINDSYPYKFKAKEADGVTYKTSDRIFGKHTGDFNKDDEKHATLKVRFNASKDATITGTFKMSVCSAANCQLEQPELSIDVHK